MRSAERRSFLLAMSLTELALILFFLLLLLSVFQLHKKDETIRALRGRNARLVALVPQVSSWLESHEGEDFQRLVRSADRAREAEARLQEQATRVQGLEERIAQLEQRNAALQARAESAAGALESSQQMERSLANLAGQLKNCQRLSRGGYGFPPCWADPATGKAEYLYRVVVREHNLGVQARWPEHRSQEVARMPGARELVAPALEVAQFRRMARPILEWSRAQQPECRHYVVIADRAQTKDGYKQKRLTIEDFFYKYEERR